MNTAYSAQWCRARTWLRSSALGAVRQILAALIATTLSVVLDMFVLAGSLFVDATLLGIGDPSLIAGTLSGDAVASILGIVPAALIGLVLWRMVLRIAFANSIQVTRKTYWLLAAVLFISLTALIEALYFALGETSSLAGYPMLFVILSYVLLPVHGLIWGETFWRFRQPVPQIEEEFA